MQPSKAWIISDTIEKNKRIFKIPVYQRNYDWNSVQCEKLYNDIIDSFLTQKKHFTGTIVYIIGEKNSSSLTEDLIIDGQQRITSIFLLLKALLDIAKEKNNSIVSELTDLIFNRHCSEEFKLKLKPVKADDLQFQALMQDDIKLFDNNSHIIRNYNLFKKLILQSIQSKFLLSDILEGMKKLEIVEIVLDKSQDDDPQVIFESINSTGLELSLADKIRNFVLMDDEQQDYLFRKYWLPLEESIGSEHLANYLITFLDYKSQDKISKNNAYEKFTKFFKSNKYTHEKLLQEIERYSKYYTAFIGRKNNYNTHINKYLNDFRTLDQTTLYPFLFDIFDDYEHNKINEETILKVLIFLRNYSLRRIVCEHPSNSLRGLYKTLYNRLFKNPINLEKYYETIYTFFITTNTKDKFVDDEEFSHSLIYKNLYNKKKACKFILASIENENYNEKVLTDSLTIEHILPQKENSIIWQKEIGNEYKYVYKTYLHTLGNLTITGYNSELGVKPFNEKKQIIKNLSKAKKLNYTLLKENTWNEKSILTRAKYLTDIALNIFSVEKIKLIEIDDSTQGSIIYTLDDNNLITGTKPVSYTFCGETISVKTYNAMLTSLLNTLYDLDPSIIENLAQNKIQLPSSVKPYISTNALDLRRSKEIGNTGIFFETNLNANNILSFIKFIIKEYEIDTDEFEFQCK